MLFKFSVGVRAFVIGLSQISSYHLYTSNSEKKMEEASSSFQRMFPISITLLLLDSNTKINMTTSIKYNHSIENAKVTSVEILFKQLGESKKDIKNVDFMPNSTGSSDYGHHFSLVLMTKYTNKGTYYPFAPTLTSSH